MDGKSLEFSHIQEWLNTASPQQTAQVTKAVLTKFGTIGTNPTSRDIVLNEIRGDASVYKAVEYLKDVRQTA